MKPIRNSAKAVIIDGGRLLSIEQVGIENTYYTIPGGGQKKGETLHETLRRECMEEINVEIEIQDILFIREYLGWNHEFSQHDGDTHQIEFMFSVRIKPGQTPSVGSIPDSGQVGVIWIPLEELNDYDFYPKTLISLFQNNASNNPIYLGDVN